MSIMAVGWMLLSWRRLNDVTACFRLGLPFDEIFFSGEIGLEVGELHAFFLQMLDQCLIALAVGLAYLGVDLIQLFVVDGLFLFQQLQSHVGGAQVARHTYEVGLVGAIAVDNVFFLGFSYTGDADGQSRERRTGVATDDVDAPLVAGGMQSAIEVVEVFHLEALAQSDAYEQLPRFAHSWQRCR